MYRIKHLNKSSQTCIPSSFSIGVIKIMTKPITVVNPIQPRTRYSRVGLLTPWVRRRGRACIRPIVKVDWIFIGNFLKHILSLLFLIENQWLSVIMIFQKNNETWWIITVNMKIYLKKCMNLCFSAPPSDSSVKQMFKLSCYCTEIFDQFLSAWLSEGTLIYHWQN